MSAPPRPAAPASAGVTLDAMEVNQVSASTKKKTDTVDPCIAHNVFKFRSLMYTSHNLLLAPLTQQTTTA